MRKGLIQVYTGDGKGKTTAALGLALRTIGQGYKVYMIQFMKGGAYTGEYISAYNYLPNFKIKQFGRPCIKQQRQLKLKGYNSKKEFFNIVRDDIICGPCRYCFLNDSIQKDYVEQGYQKCLEIIESGEHDLIILDEINVAMSLGMIDENLILKLIEKKPKHVELILTGRNAPKKILEKADLVTVMKLQKHYYNNGICARRGIEY